MERGYVKLWRSIEENELLENDNTAFIVFTKLLTRVNRLNGTYTTGRKRLANVCNMNPNTLYSALKRLEASTIIQQRSNSSSTTITICNWWKYQQDVNNASTMRRAAVNTKQEREKEREYIDTKVSMAVKPVKVPGKEKSSSKRDVLGILNKVTGRNFSVEPDGIKQTKSKFTDEEIEQALRNMYKDDWHKLRMTTLKSDYLLRATTIDQFKDFKRPDERYVLPGSIVKQVARPKTPSLSRAALIEKEYQS